jgi:hypothetical protein
MEKKKRIKASGAETGHNWFKNWPNIGWSGCKAGFLTPQSQQPEYNVHYDQSDEKFLNRLSGKQW